MTTDMAATPRDDAESIYRAIGEAWENDPEYRALCETDPRRALASKGVDLPGNLDVRVCANGGDKVHFVFPPDPNALLGDETLAAVHGGVRLSTGGSGGSVGSLGSAPSCISSASSVSSLGTAAAD